MLLFYFVEVNSLNDIQKQNILLLLKKAKALQFLVSADILKIADNSGLDITVSRGQIRFNGHSKELEHVEALQIKGIWTPAFWVWLLGTFIELDIDTIIIDFDATALDYCRAIFKASMDHHNNHR